MAWNRGIVYCKLSKENIQLNGKTADKERTSIILRYSWPLAFVPSQYYRIHDYQGL